MAKGIFFIFIFFFSLHSFAQKPPIDPSIFEKWPLVGDPAISNNGNYVLYYIKNIPVNSSTLVVQSSNNDWRKEFIDASNAIIMNDNEFAIFNIGKDSLCLLKLGSDDRVYIENVSSFKLPKSDNGGWLAYLLNSPAHELIICNTKTGGKSIIYGVIDYLFNDKGNALLLETETKKGNEAVHSLQLINLPDIKATRIWDGENASNFVFSSQGDKLAFVVECKKDNVVYNSIWYYGDKINKAEKLADDQSLGISGGLVISTFNSFLGVYFSNDGDRLFFNLEERECPKPQKDSVKVDIWNYRDPKLQSLQLAELDPSNYFPCPPIYKAVISIIDRRIFRLELENEKCFFFAGSNNDGDVLIGHIEGDINEWNWNRTSQASVYLVNTKTGVRKKIKENAISYQNYYLTPSGKYVVYYDPERENYFSYSVELGITKNITLGIREKWTPYDSDQPNSDIVPLGVATFTKGDTSILIYGRNDIFQIDLDGKHSPINLTQEYGRTYHIKFRILNGNISSIDRTEQLLLATFNPATKENGFYGLQLGMQKAPKLLTMGPYLYYWPSVSLSPPLKAKNAECYIVQRMSAVEAPNFFITRDFKTFSPLSNIQPQKNYNWLSAELMTWKTVEGELTQGILYKPENFSPYKKYPIIFNYYERVSDKLNEFLMPDYSADNINIPYFVSNGYLVFTPDIHYKIGRPGNSSYDAILSAAKYLSKYSWIDRNKMGIQGHSFGGFETNYLITHTNIFAAAMSSAGVSDCISSYGSVLGRGPSRQHIYELTQSRIGATLWQRPDLYIKNSPIFRADKIKTPLLMMSNKGDAQVPFAQGLEFFTALRRLGKKAWMLQYDDGEHRVRGNSACDLTMRMQQFFDHYLKGVPPPYWMTKGIPAKRKGIDNGFDLDTKVKTPGQGLLNVRALEKLK